MFLILFILFLPSFQPIQELREVVLNILQDPNRTRDGTAILYLKSFPLVTQVKVTEEHQEKEKKSSEMPLPSRLLWPGPPSQHRQRTDFCRYQQTHCSALSSLDQSVLLPGRPGLQKTSGSSEAEGRSASA